MPSKRKRKIARQNGAKAAGAKSPQGIEISALNALRHGLTSKTLVLGVCRNETVFDQESITYRSCNVRKLLILRSRNSISDRLLANESPAKFDDMLQTYIEKFQPQDGVEMNLVDEMVAARWRQQRCWAIQTASIDLQMETQEFEIRSEPQRLALAFITMANQEKVLELIMRYEISFSRMHDRAMKALFRMREELNLRNDAKHCETSSKKGAVRPSEPVMFEVKMPSRIPSAEGHPVKANQPKAPERQPLSPEPDACPVETNPEAERPTPVSS